MESYMMVGEFSATRTGRAIFEPSLDARMVEHMPTMELLDIIGNQFL